ncbi:hypothetical protein [Anatilimnocola aggregata]|nr:hypothetical protein [Anatilimnocola aggregata]
MTNPKIPEVNNVYGHIQAPQGLNVILHAVTPVVGEQRAFVHVSQFNGDEILRFASDVAEFESIPLEEPSRHLLNGCVAGSLDEVVAFVRALSGQLAQAAVEHRFEVYDSDQQLIQQLPR